MESFVQHTIHQAVATITFHHTQSNSLPAAILRQLAQTIEQVGKQAGIKVILLQSVGDKAFCAGASFTELAAISNEVEGLAFFSGFAHVINAIRKTPAIVIGRIHQKCVGGGVGIAAAVDYAFAHSAAAVKLSELAVGIGPFVVGPAIERKIGLSAFSQLAIDATRFQTANWAKEKGLYCEVLEDITELDNRIALLTNTLAASSGAALQRLKQIFWKDTDHWDTLLLERAGISGQLILGEEAQSFVRKYAQ